MSHRKTIALLSVLLGTIVLLGQSRPKASNSALAVEFPVLMQQNVESGKTPVGTKIKAKLAVATLDHGVVIPKDAILFGEVIESAAKSPTEPSRLAIRVDSVQWKKGSAPIVLALSPEVYLTAWYYPSPTPTARDFAASVPSSTHRDESGPIPTGDVESPHPSARHLPQDAHDTMEPAPPALSTKISWQRVLMKNIKSARGRDQRITLTSTRSNIKLDKSTTYVLAAGDLLPTKID
jgi:hypothetical protein